ncbi:hypothetical protein [Mesorhizobium sp. M0244]|uniref:hypothetical protein n=1 Tax=unclassified Mesorhizobium TaxID=325217 RepID=UPI0033376665
MTNELPKFSRVELVLGERVGKVASPLLKQGSMTLEAALAAAYPIAARQLIDAGENPQEVEAAVARQVASHGILPEYQTFAISEVLHAALLDSFAAGSPCGDLRNRELLLISVSPEGCTTLCVRYVPSPMLGSLTSRPPAMSDARLTSISA